MWLLMVEPGHIADPGHKALRGEGPVDRGAQLDAVPLLRRQPDMHRQIMKLRAEHDPEHFFWEVSGRDHWSDRTVGYWFMEFEEV